jgi:hypothetical protein
VTDIATGEEEGSNLRGGRAAARGGVAGASGGTARERRHREGEAALRGRGRVAAVEAGKQRRWRGTADGSGDEVWADGGGGVRADGGGGRRNPIALLGSRERYGNKMGRCGSG